MTIRFGTLGAARITATALMAPCADQPRAAVAVVAARNPVRARQFAARHGIPRVLDRYDDVVSHPDVDAVYLPLPIAAHHAWALRALRAGKHVLCEKSFAANAAQAGEMAAVARDTGLVLMDAFHYRYHPVFQRARDIYRSGELGEIREIDAAFHVPIEDRNDIRMQYHTGGGVTMDIGCYPISWVRHLTGSEPETLTASAEVGPPDVDVRLSATMTFPGGIAVTTSGDMRPGIRFTAHLIVRGTAGTLHVVNPLAPQMGHEIRVSAGSAERIETLDRRSSYAYQLDAFLDAVEHGAPLFTDAEDAVRQMRVIDRCYRAAGLPVRGLDGTLAQPPG